MCLQIKKKEKMFIIFNFVFSEAENKSKIYIKNYI